jgi:hypothetical protein
MCLILLEFGGSSQVPAEKALVFARAIFGLFEGSGAIYQFDGCWLLVGREGGEYFASGVRWFVLLGPMSRSSLRAAGASSCANPGRDVWDGDERDVKRAGRGLCDPTLR